VTLCGPEHTSLAAFSTRYFLVRPRLKIHIREFKSTSNDPNCAFQDENLKVFPIVIDVTGEEEEEENMSFSSQTSPSPSSSSPSLSDYFSSVADFEYSFHPMSTPQPVSGLTTTKKTLPTKFTPRGKISKSPPTLPPDPSSLTTSASAPSPTSSITSIKSSSYLTPPESSTTSTSAAMNTETVWMQNVEEVINLRKSLPTPQGNPSTKVVCYACHTADTPGKFDMKKARSLGVTPGPNCGLLVKGQSITLPNGNVVNPSDCIAPAESGPIFLVVECPSTRYLHLLTTSAGFSPYFTTSSSSSSSPPSSVECIFHFSPPEVLITTQYQEWMTKFGENTQHVIANDHHW
jgi:ribonuclease Z